MCPLLVCFCVCVSVLLAVRLVLCCVCCVCSVAVRVRGWSPGIGSQALRVGMRGHVLEAVSASSAHRLLSPFLRVTVQRAFHVAETVRLSSELR